MNPNMRELERLARQMKNELEWVYKTGLARPEPPDSKVPRGRQEAGSVGVRQASEPRSPESRFESEGRHSHPPEVRSRSSALPLVEEEGTPGGPAMDPRLAACTSLEGVREILGPCTRCKLHGLGRKQIVFGTGNPQAELMFVGEGPGAEEDRRGEPFVGKAGALLTRIIEKGMGLQREDVYIANIVKCRPPKNRDPEADEVAACEPFLLAQVNAIRPRVLVTLGRYAGQSLLKTTTPITRLRGTWCAYNGIPVMPTFHPAYLLRNPAEKRKVWEDVQAVLEKLGRALPGKEDKSS